MLAGVGLLVVCCSSSSVAATMMGGGEETPDPVVPKTPAKKSPDQIEADKAKAALAALKADPDATPAEVATAQLVADAAADAAADTGAGAGAGAGPDPKAEVFYIGGYEYTKAQAAGVCTTRDAVVATGAQLSDAQAAGADWCSTGWLSDQSKPKYPITTNVQGGCGNGSSGIKEYLPPTGKAGVNCYGVKPESATAKFSEYKQSRHGPTSEVFYVGGYDYTKAQAVGVCAKHGATVASNRQLIAAREAGADWCATGWLSDQTVAKYPINTTIMPGCGGSPSVVEYTPPTGKAGVNCFGVKPEKVEGAGSDATLRKWNSTKWSRHE
jgi:hypothetical protein